MAYKTTIARSIMRRAVTLIFLGSFLCMPCYPKNILSGAKALVGKIKSTIQSSVNSALPDVEVKWQEDDRQATLEEVEHSITNSLHTVRSELQDILHEFDTRINQEVNNMDQHIFTYVSDAEERVKRLLEQIDTMLDSKTEYIIYHVSTILEELDQICTKHIETIGSQCDDILTRKITQARAQLDEAAHTAIEFFLDQLEIRMNTLLQQVDTHIERKIDHACKQTQTLLYELEKLCSRQRDTFEKGVTRQLKQLRTELDASLAHHVSSLQYTITQAGYTACGSGAAIIGIYILAQMVLDDPAGTPTFLKRCVQGSLATTCITGGLACVAYSYQLATSATEQTALSEDDETTSLSSTA